MHTLRTLTLLIFVSLSPALLCALPQDESEDVIQQILRGLTPAEIPNLTKQAAAGDRQAQVILGWASIAGAAVNKDYSEAAKWLQAASDQGSAMGACGLATVFTSPKGPGQDYAKAMALYHKSADAGQACGAFNLGMMYELGEGVPANFQEALRWYRSAAERKGYFAGRAQQYLADLYFHGQGVSQDYKRAAILYALSEETGVHNPEAEMKLGVMYAEGVGVAKDEKKSDEWFLKAAENGNTKAQTIMGTGYLEQKNYSAAAKWLSKAAEAGDPDAQLSLAGMYTNGEGFKQDDAEAMKWATKAAEQRNTDAFHFLGFIHCCRIPSTMPEDDVASYMWFILAKRAGDKKADDFIAMLIPKMEKAQLKEAAERADQWRAEHPQVLK